VRTPITVDPRFASLGLVADSHQVKIPQGWTASVFFAGSELRKPRFLAWGSDSVLYVANMSGNNILAFPDTNGDGIADQARICATVPGNTSSITFHRDTMYVGSESGIRKLWRSTGSGFVYDKNVVLVDKASQAGQTGGNHRTRTVVVDTNTMKIYLSVGSRGNADREPTRALVERYDWDGSNRTTVATGVRNAVGMTLHPRTGKLWANNNGSDNQGNNVPPEWVDIVRQGGFYGYPIGYHDHNWFDFLNSDYKDIPPITADDSANIKSLVRPAALVDAHSAPMQLVFSNERMPQGYRTGLFMVMRGSWNRSPISGTKVVYFVFDNDADTIANEVQNFCSNFIIDSTNEATRWARPVGIALAADGSVFITSDDKKQFILKLTPPTSSTSVGEQTATLPENSSAMLIVRPNPSADMATLEIAHTEADPSRPTDGTLTIVDALGGTVSSTPVQLPCSINTAGLAQGTYALRFTCGAFSRLTQLRVVR
jgi:glucose/arabinose dehydrogenase